MLEDNAVGLDWKLEQIAIFPIVALLVDERVSGALDRNEHHAALAALLAAAAPGRTGLTKTRIVSLRNTDRRHERYWENFWKNMPSTARRNS